jgi:hypothetical protein
MDEIPRVEFRPAGGRSLNLEVIAMLNEGVITSDTKALMKSEMLKQLWHLGNTTPDLLERAVFRSLTGGTREDVDWGVEDNHAGYFLWIHSFDQLIGELAEDGYLQVESLGDERHLQLVPVEALPSLGISSLVYPQRG